MAYTTGFTNIKLGVPAPGATASDIGFVYDKDGNAVLSEQQAAIADATGTDDDVTINEILAALRAHGLIAT